METSTGCSPAMGSRYLAGPATTSQWIVPPSLFPRIVFSPRPFSADDGLVPLGAHRFGQQTSSSQHKFTALMPVAPHTQLPLRLPLFLCKADPSHLFTEGLCS